jgi:hypothetical protein
VRNSHVGMSVAMTPRVKKIDMPRDTNEGGLDISFTRGDKQHCLGVSVFGINNILADMTLSHIGLLRNLSRCVTEHRMSLDDGAYELVFSTKDATRVQCMLLHTAARNCSIASSDVNFSNNMVYTNVCAAGVDNVVGVERLALKMASRLQENLTPENIGKRLRSLSCIDKEIERLLGLISSTDIATDIEHVFKSTDTSMNQLRLELANLSMKTYKHSVNDIASLQQKQFGRSPIFVEKRATSSSRAERPRWQDGPTPASRSDNLMRQKMMSARGVATLSLYTASKHGGDPLNTCVVFSDVKVPKMIYNEPKSAGRSSMSATRLSWVAPPSVDTTHSDKSRIRDQFMYSFNRSYKESRVFNQRTDAEKTEHTLAMFVNADSTARGNVRTFVQKCVPKGSLLGALVDCCRTHPSLYTRALAHLILVDSMYRTDLVSGNKGWGRFTHEWVNMYRTQFIATLAKRGDLTEGQADQQYIDYCMFNQCLKQHINGTRMPCDSFSLLVQQGIPFPYA